MAWIVSPNWDDLALVFVRKLETLLILFLKSHHVCDSVRSREWSCTRFKSREQIACRNIAWVNSGQASTLSRLLGLQVRAVLLLKLSYLLHIDWVLPTSYFLFPAYYFCSTFLCSSFYSHPFETCIMDSMIGHHVYSDELSQKVYITLEVCVKFHR